MLLYIKILFEQNNTTDRNVGHAITKIYIFILFTRLSLFVLKILWLWRSLSLSIRTCHCLCGRIFVRRRENGTNFIIIISNSEGFVLFEIYQIICNLHTFLIQKWFKKLRTPWKGEDCWKILLFLWSIIRK